MEDCPQLTMLQIAVIIFSLGFVLSLEAMTSMELEHNFTRYNDTFHGKAALIGNKWPKNEVPYVIERSVDQSSIPKLRSAMHRLSATSCIKFHTKRSSDRNYLLFQNNKGDSTCQAAVGFQGGMQTANFGKGCSEGNIVHEIIHALGFFHEQARDDRNSYVKINMGNVKDGLGHNFERSIERGFKTTTYEIKYNYESIMHYGAKSFSRNGRNTIDIVPNHPGALGNPRNMGQRNTITAGDSRMINSRYCPGTENVEELEPGTDPGSLNPEEEHLQETCEGRDETDTDYIEGGEEYVNGCIILCQHGDLNCETICPNY